MINVNIIDIGIIVLILCGAILGFSRGFTKEVVSCVGFLLVVVLAFILKNPISTFLYENLPFFSFWGVFKGVTVLNIALYEIIAFLICFIILEVALKILLLATTLFEAILNATIILGIPSKILGAIVGVFQYYVVAFIALYVLSLPIFSVPLQDSKLGTRILNETPVLSGVADKMLSVVDEFADLKEKYKSDTNAREFNSETLKLFLKYDVVTVESVEKLISNKKLNIEPAEWEELKQSIVEG